MGAHMRRNERNSAAGVGWEQRRRPKKCWRNPRSEWHEAGRGQVRRRMGRRRRRGRFEFRMRARVLSEPNVKPAEMPARVASPGVPTGRMPATEVAASGVASPASVLRFCGGEKTYHGQQDRKDVQRPHKGGSSSGHGPPTAGNVHTFYSRLPVRW